MAGQTSSASPAIGMLLRTALYVGDLHADVTETQLRDQFSRIGEVSSVRICKDYISRNSLGYGYVNYCKPEDADKALEELNFLPLHGKPIRIMYSNRDPNVRKSSAGNLFVKNLDKEIDSKALQDIFSSYGSILSSKVVTDASGESMGYGFVQYTDEESAQKAVQELHGTLLNGKQVFVGPFLGKRDRERMSADKTIFTNVFVKNLSESTSEEVLKMIFGEFGPLTSTVIMRNEDGSSKCFGFVNFWKAEDAAKAVESLNGQSFDGKEWYIRRAQKKSEREIELKQHYEQPGKDSVSKLPESNLYIKNLDDSIDDAYLKDLFSPFGSITSSKVMRNTNGRSKGVGFVAFSNPEEATRAISDLNGTMIAGKPLYVVVAERKEDRKARLEVEFSKRNSMTTPFMLAPRMSTTTASTVEVTTASTVDPQMPVTTASTVDPQMPMYPPPGGFGLAQQLVYRQPPPFMIHPQHGFGYQQQFVPRMRHPYPSMPNTFMPVHMRQQMLPRGLGYGYPSRHGTLDASLQGMGGSMPTFPMIPHGRGGLPLGSSSQMMQVSQQIPNSALAGALANATPNMQRNMLGDNLYTLVEQLEPQNASKVTGMLLEMNHAEILHLLESPEALQAKVAEAMRVLRRNAAAMPQQDDDETDSIDDQLASLTEELNSLFG